MLTRLRKCLGASAVEVGAAMVIFIPLMIILFLLMQEVGFAYMIKSNLDEAARKAARQLAIDYGLDPVNSVTSGHQTAVYTQVRIPYFVASNSQFSPASFNTTTPPFSVTVSVTYPAGGIPGALPPFNDALHLGIANTVQLSGKATCSLE